jgi:hypothetical protein
MTGLLLSGVVATSFLLMGAIAAPNLRQGTNGDSRFDGGPDPGSVPATRQDMQPYIDAAKLIDPLAGAALEAAANGGSLGFAWLYDVRDNGCHDWNTIGINIKSKRIPPAYGAVSLLHEWQHVRGCPRPCEI